MDEVWARVRDRQEKDAKSKGVAEAASSSAAPAVDDDAQSVAPTLVRWDVLEASPPKPWDFCILCSPPLF